MSNQVISYADLTIINSALRSISTDMRGVYSELGTINFKQDQLESDLEKLANSFADFVAADVKHKALQLAETRVGNLRQELQIKFGYYAEVRRMATGMLQGVDTGVVSDETLKATTEEVMIKAPGYWLAPVLVAIAAWIRNDKETVGHAMAEALKRDDYKTTLFFMLVTRRLSRNEAGLQWLERYFMHQNPHNLDREFIVILEAVTTGVFPPASRQLMMSHVKDWLRQLTQTDHFVNEQKKQWVAFFEASGPLHDGDYALLQKYATNWDALEKSLKEAKTHKILHDHFTDVIASSSDFSKGLKIQLDEILSLLVTNFDDEELPLQQQVRLNQLIVQMDGDKAAAQAIIDAERHIFDQQVDFLQLLTNACFHPELSGATKVTQALAVSISQPWIVEAHDTFTAQTRNRIPISIDLDIDTFKICTTNGDDEKEMVLKQEEFYAFQLQMELKKLSFPYALVIIGALIATAGLIFIPLGLIATLIGVVIIWSAINNNSKAKKTLRISIEERKNKAKEVLRGCVAETVDYRRHHTNEDGNAEVLRQLLTSITPEDFSTVSKDISRSII